MQILHERLKKRRKARKNDSGQPQIGYTHGFKITQCRI